MRKSLADHITWLDDLRRTDVALAGGKGANLGELLANGFPVPPGFVVTAPACERFFASLHLDRQIAAFSDSAPAEVKERIAGIVETIRTADVAAELADAVLAAHAQLRQRCGAKIVCAVRSSATTEDSSEASFAGQHGTFYYVNEASLVQMVRNCWASLWTDEAVSYRDSHGINHASATMAVVVQEMIPSEISGVAFTVNPVSGARDEIVIESSWGMGAAIVDGRVTPDRYVIERNGLKPKETRLAQKRFRVSTHIHRESDGRLKPVRYSQQQALTLTPDLAAAVARWALRAEEHFGSPQDVEWAVANGEVFLLQSRPVTVAGQTEFCRNERGGKYVLFKPVFENFTDPVTPLTANLWLQGTVASLIVSIGGRFYLDLGKVRRVFPFKLTDAELAQVLYLSYEGVPPTLKLSLCRLPVGALFVLAVTLMYANVYTRSANLPTDFLDRFRDLAESVDQDPSLGVRATLGALFYGRSLLRALCAPLGNQPILVNVSTGRYFVWMWLLRRILRRYQPDLPPDSFSLLSSGSEAVLSAETGRRIWQLSVIARRNDTVRRALTEYPPDEASALLREDSAAADFIAALDSFLSRFGHRAMKEFEFKAPRWEEDPAPVLGMVRNYLTAESNPDEHERRIATRREELIDTIRKGLRGRLFEHTLGVRFRLIRFVADRVRYYVTMRENSRFYWSMSAYILRKKILRLEADYLKRDLLKCKDDIFYLDWDEIEKLGDGTIGWLDVEDRLLERRREHVRLSKITAPRTVGIETAAAKGPVESDGAGGTTLRGQAASPGHYEGPARVILDPALDVELHPGEILVAPYTDPAWTPLFLTAGAAVVEVGSFLSHAGTVAREYGLPCIVDVADCTARIRTGDHLLVDCTAGEVRVLNRAGDEQ